jgi:hypothetical protein
LPVIIEAFDQIASTAAEHKNCSPVRIMLKHGLNPCSKRMEPSPHVSDTAGEIDADFPGRPHQRSSSAANTLRSTASSSRCRPEPVLRSETQFRSAQMAAFCLAPMLLGGAGGGRSASKAGCTSTGANPLTTEASIASRHVWSGPVPMPCRRATSAMTVPGRSVSRTIRSFSSGPHRRCRTRRTRSSICSVRAFNLCRDHRFAHAGQCQTAALAPGRCRSDDAHAESDYRQFATLLPASESLISQALQCFSAGGGQWKVTGAARFCAYMLSIRQIRAHLAAKNPVGPGGIDENDRY